MTLMTVLLSIYVIGILLKNYEHYNTLLTELKMSFVLAFIIAYNKISIIEKIILQVIYLQNKI